MLLLCMWKLRAAALCLRQSSAPLYRAKEPSLPLRTSQAEERAHRLGHRPQTSTLSQAPKLETDARARPEKVKPTAQLEAEALAALPPFHARPIKCGHASLNSTSSLLCNMCRVRCWVPTECSGHFAKHLRTVARVLLPECQPGMPRKKPGTACVAKPDASGNHDQ